MEQSIIITLTISTFDQQLMKIQVVLLEFGS